MPVISSKEASLILKLRGNFTEESKEVDGLQI